MISDSSQLESGVRIPPVAFLALSLAAFASSISSRLTDPLLPRLAGEFGITLSAASYVITFFAIAYGLAQLLFGPTGDRFGKYRVIAWACMACAAGSLLCAAAPSFSLLLLARLFTGAMAAAVIPLSMAWIGDVVAYRDRQPVLARFLIGQILGVSAGVVVGGYTADHLSWRTPFVGIAIGFIAIGLVLLALNRGLPPAALVTRRADGHALQRMLRDFQYVLARPWARVILLTVFLEGAFLYGAFAFITTHLHRTHHISLSRAGTVAMLFGFGGLLFAASAAAMVKRLGETGLAKWGGMLIGISLLVVGFAPVWQWSIPGCFGAGFGFYMLHNTLQINATQMAPERRGAAVAAFASCFFLGQSFGVAAAGALAEHLGTATVMAIGAVAVLLVGLYFSRLRARLA